MKRSRHLPLRALLLLLLLLPLPVAGWYLLRERDQQLVQVQLEIASLRERLDRRAAAELPRAAASPAALEIITAGSEALATADLQSRLVDLARTSTAELDSVEILPSKERSPFRQLRLRLRLRSDHAGLRDFLLAVERSRPRLLVDRFSVRAFEEGRSLESTIELSALAHIENMQQEGALR